MWQLVFQTRRRAWLLIIGLLAGLFVLMGLPAVDRAQEKDTADLEVQGRGPLHEAFAQPWAPNPQPALPAPRQPPEPIPEEPPAERPEGDNVQWIPGYWAWDPERNDFIWVSGVWRQTPPGQTYVSGYWEQVEGGWRWVPGFWAPATAEQLEYLPPPPDSLEQGPVAPPPAEDCIYSPGYWVFRQGNYLWHPGCWLRARPGWVWVPPRYVWTPAGCLFLPGYWDYPLETRGLLFAPVVFYRPIWRVAGWSFCPRWVIEPAPLLGCLFLGPQASSYWFGDCFALAGPRRLFTLWIDLGPRGYDPLWTYYRFTCGQDPAWLPGLRQLYLDRLAGRVPRPPRTLIQQNTFVQNTTTNNINKTNIININNSTPSAPTPAASPLLRQQVTPLLLARATQVQSTPLRLTTQPLPPSTATRTLQHLQEAARVRRQWERQGQLPPRVSAGAPTTTNTIKTLKLSQVTGARPPSAASQAHTSPAPPASRPVSPPPAPRPFSLSPSVTPPAPPGSRPAPPASIPKGVSPHFSSAPPASSGEVQKVPTLPQKKADPPLASPGRGSPPAPPRLPPPASRTPVAPPRPVPPSKTVEQVLPPARSAARPNLDHLPHRPPSSPHTALTPLPTHPAPPPRSRPLPTQNLHQPVTHAPQPALRPPPAPPSRAAAGTPSPPSTHRSPPSPRHSSRPAR
jgi:hypothetical protein